MKTKIALLILATVLPLAANEIEQATLRFREGEAANSRAAQTEVEAVGKSAGLLARRLQVLATPAIIAAKQEAEAAKARAKAELPGVIEAAAEARKAQVKQLIGLAAAARAVVDGVAVEAPNK